MRRLFLLKDSLINRSFIYISRACQFIVIGGLFIGCSTIVLPVQEYTLARSALEFAEKNDGERLAPHHFMQAQQVYKQAVEMYENRNYDQARNLFIKSRKLAEKVETTARVNKAKSGEVL